MRTAFETLQPTVIASEPLQTMGETALRTAFEELASTQPPAVEAGLPGGATSTYYTNKTAGTDYDYPSGS